MCINAEYGSENSYRFSMKDTMRYNCSNALKIILGESQDDFSISQRMIPRHLLIWESTDHQGSGKDEGVHEELMIVFGVISCAYTSVVLLMDLHSFHEGTPHNVNTR